MNVPSLPASEAAPAAAPAIQVEHLSTTYRVRMGSSSTWGSLRQLGGKRRRQALREVHALRDVSFDVPRGSVLGVIGRNGAGKSTLLRTIAGILSPGSGRVVVRGRIAALLSIGVGFNGSLSGRENIRLGGLAVGLSPRRLDDLTEAIADFTELGEYLDFPVNGYSTGMRSRLGFAVAAHLDPDVLLIDEALSGGDANFKERTAKKMAELCGDGRTIVLVSHGLSTVRSMATNALWLHEGQLIEQGETDDVLQSYMRYCRLEALDAMYEDDE